MGSVRTRSLRPLPPRPTNVAQKIDRGVQLGEGAFQAAEARRPIVGLDRRGAGLKVVLRNFFKQMKHLIYAQG